MYKELMGMSSFVEVWSNSAEGFSDKTAFIWGGEEYTYYEVEMMVNSFAISLSEDYAITKGEKIALVLGNSIHFIVSYLAIQRIGAIPVPFNTRLKSQQFDILFGMVRPTLVIASRQFQAAIEPLLEFHTCVKHRIGVDIADPDWESFDALCTAYQEPAQFPLPSRTDIGTILFTSGTTGKPKGAVLAHGDLLWNIYMTSHVFEFVEDDVHILTVPLFHCTGLESIFPTSVFHGSTCVLDDQINPAYLIELLSNYGATTFITVPTVLYLLTAYSGLDTALLSSLRLIGFSGSTINPETLSRLIELFPSVELVNFYGLTETTSIITCCRSSDLVNHPSSIGRQFEGIDIRIADKDKVCDAGETGELQISKKHIVREYFNDPGDIEKRMTGNWFRTGDLAAIDENGLVYLKGRNIDLIIVGGENVFAPEVEGVLNSHPNVRESAVIGIPNKIFGEVVKAFVVPKQADKANALELKKFCFERLPSYKVPIEISFLDALPRTSSGKVQKGTLIAELPKQ